MDVEAYLQRIGYHGTREPTAETLRQLHRAHLYAVPFENLDIPLGRPIVLSLPLLFEKIVERRRGGFCYELNGLFAWLLEALGYQVVMHSARVFDGGHPGPEFDHMLLRVDTSETLLADVGFGDSFIDPLPFDDQEHLQHGRAYRLVERDEAWVLHQRKPASDWEPQYVFSLKPRRLDEFGPMCHYQQTSPESSFTKKSVCSRASRTGRITVSNGRLIVTSDGSRQETNIADESAYRALLRTHFGIELGQEAPVDRLVDSNLWLPAEDVR